MIDYKQFIELLRQRHSCRAYNGEAVAKDDLTAIMEAGRLAQSACNKQPWRFVVADTAEPMAAVCGCYDREWAQQAGAFVVVCGNEQAAWKRGSDGWSSMDTDVAIACENMCLAAYALGIGSCWICNFDVARLSSVLNLPQELTPLAIIALGHPADGDAAPAKIRKNAEEIVKWGSF